MFTRAELERANAQLHAHFLALSGQIFGELAQLERLIASRPPAARVSGLAMAAEIASAQRQLRAQMDRLSSSSLQRYESLRRALDAQQGVLRQLSFIVEQHTPAQRRETAPGASVARPPGLTPETRRQQSVPRNPTPAAQEQIPRVYTSPAPPTEQFGAPAQTHPEQPSAVRDRDSTPAWSRHLRRLRVGSRRRVKTARAHRLLANARKRVYPVVTGVGARSLGLLAMVMAGAVVSYGMFPYASEQPNAAVKPIEIVTRKIGGGPMPAGAPPPLPPIERGPVVDLASPPVPPPAAAPPRIAQEAPAPPPRPSPAPFSAAAERTPSLSPSGLATRAERPVPARVAALQPEIAVPSKSAPPPAAAAAAVRQPAPKADPAIAALPKADPVVAIAPVPAAVAPDAGSDVLKRFGMLGRVAVDCSAPHSPSNPHQIYAVARGGNITRTFRTNNPKFDATLSLRNVRMLTPDLLQFEESGRASELTVTMIKIDGKFRNWHSTQADGTVLIADGKFSDSGKLTTAFKFCGN